LEGHSDNIQSVTFSPDGSLIASGAGGTDDTVKIWKVADGSLVRTLTGHIDDVESVSFSPDGKLLISGSGDTTIKMWKVSDGSLIRMLTGHTGWVHSVSFSPDGSLIVSGSADDTIKIWRVSDGSLVRTLTGHTGWVISVSFSPDGSLIASGSADNTIKIWKVSDGSLVRTLTGHTGLVSSVSFSPDGNLIASGSYDNTIKIWRVSDGSLIRTLAGHADYVYSVAFSPDGSLIVSGGKDGLALWRVGTPINRPPSDPSLLFPANNATVSPTPTFKVKSVDPNGDNVKYVIEVTSGNDARTFETGFYPSGQEATYTVPSNRQLSAGQWSWRAKAIDSKGLQSGWSQSQTFTVNVTNNPPSTPVLLSPVNQTVSPVPTFKLKSDDPDNDQVMFIMEVKQGGILKSFQTGFYSSGVEVTYSDSKQPLSDGQWQWRAKARDKRGAESGWSEWKTFTVQSNLPDLVPIDLKVTPDTVRLGNEVTVSFKVLNQGRKRANASKTRIILSKSASEPSSSDPLLKELSTPALDPNKSQDYSESVVIPADIQTGDYYVWVVVDVDKTSGQGDDTNDKAKFPIKVQEKLDYDVLVVEEVVRKEGGKEIIEEKPVAGARIIVFDENHNIITEGTTNREGKAKIPALKVGHYIRAEKYITTFYLNDRNEAIEQKNK
jgi:WD40 repeat protein